MKQLSMQWLIDSQHKEVGLIKANLNDLEARLRSILYRQQFDAARLNNSIQLSLTIQNQYEKLSHLLSCDDESSFVNIKQEQHHYQFCLQQIEILKTNLLGFTSEHTLFSKYQKISYYYGLLAECLKSEISTHQKRQTAPASQNLNQDCLLTAFIHAQNEEVCMANFIAFIKHLETPCPFDKPA